MASNENSGYGSKKWLIPVVWIGGIVLAGGLITSLFLYGRQKNRTAESEKALVEVRNALSNERDSLAYELELILYGYDTLMADYEGLTGDHDALQEKNRQMAAANAARNSDLKKLREEKDALATANNLQREEYNAMDERVHEMQSRMDELSRELAGLQEENALLAQELEDKNTRIAADSAARAAEAALPPPPKVSGFTNITGLTGAYGLADVSVPYSHYFFGISNVFGYTINRRFTTGIGLGVHVYNGGVQSPLFLDFRYTFRPENTYSLYFDGSGGLMINYSDFGSTNLFINPVFGVRRTLSEKISANLGTGLFIQNVNGARHSFINLKLGLSVDGKR